MTLNKTLKATHMKKINPTLWVTTLTGIALSALLFSFSNFLPGAHSFQVYFDGKLMADQYISSRSEIPKLMLNPAEKYNQLIVKYDECGRTVSGRIISIKDDKNTVLKEWRFNGTTSGYKDAMPCAWKEITTLAKKGNVLKLYYASKEFPEGQQIAYLMIGDETKAGAK
jgi:hypothetical protein